MHRQFYSRFTQYPFPIRQVVFMSTEAIGNPFPRQSSAFDDRTLGKISDLMLRHRPTFYRERYGCALYVQREGRCILFSNVCSGSDDPQLPGRSFDRRSTDSRSHSIRKEW